MVDYYLRKLGDPILREKCVEVYDFSDLDDLLGDMKKIMNKHMGSGIAAPQVGDNRRIFLANVHFLTKEFINPEIVSSYGYFPFLDGCLSVPNKAGFSVRKFSVNMKYQDRFGEEHLKRYSGLSAFIVQHELDHLEGKLFFD